MPDQPLPTLAEIANWLREYAADLRGEADESASRGRSGIARNFAAIAERREAAARQLEAMAGQGREVERRARDLMNLTAFWSWVQAQGFEPDEVAALRSALTAPPAEEPRERGNA